jgi:hypothetical protein
MKKFLLRQPSNRAWVESQERQHASALSAVNIEKDIRRELYPELNLARVSALQQSSNAKEILVMARQRQLLREVLRELIDLNINDVNEDMSKAGKKSINRKVYMPWHTKAQAIFFYFHENLGQRNAEFTCLLFGVNSATFRNWVEQKAYYPKWVVFVKEFTFADVYESIPLSHRDSFETVPKSSRVNLPNKYLDTSRNNVVFTCAFGDGSRQGKRKAVNKTADIVYVTKKSKMIGSGRNVKYQDEEAFIIDAIVSAWETGNPLSRSRCYDILISKYGSSSNQWVTAMDLNSRSISPALSQWLQRTLMRNGYSVRKESISQTVPQNWLVLAVEACDLIRSTMKKANVTRLVNMDEMFLNFYPKETHLIAPTNTKRIGSNRSEDSKKGCTVAVGCEMFESKLLAPFVIMDGTTDGYLARRYCDWGGAAVVKFQNKHWMDKSIATSYLDWLSSCYPDEKIGLIWDFAAAHKCAEVLTHAQSLNITVTFVPAGLTSVLQVCDLVVNKALKQHFKRKYCFFKVRNDPGPGGKYAVHRDDILYWIEDAVQTYNENQLLQRGVSKAFTKYGQDPRCVDNSGLMNYLVELKENNIYLSLLENQKALEFD